MKDFWFIVISVFVIACLLLGLGVVAGVKIYQNNSQIEESQETEIEKHYCHFFRTAERRMSMLFVDIDEIIDGTEKPMTNADRIRAMSDEKLAEFLCEVYDEDEDSAKFIYGYYIPCYNQYDIKEWLKQPAEEWEDDRSQ